MNHTLAWVGTIFLGCLLLAAAVCAQEGAVVRGIEIIHQGPPAAADSFIRAHMRTGVGRPYTTQDIDHDVRKLAEMKLFANIEVRRESVAEGVRVIFVLTGKPKIRDIVIAGNKAIRTSTLKKKLTIKTGELLDGFKVEESVEKLVELYQKKGFQHVKITHEEAVATETGQAVVTFHVEEGTKIVIDQIDFVGNKAFTSRQLLRQMKTKGTFWFAWTRRSNRVREEVMEEDRARLRDFYLSHGYVDMEVEDITIEKVSEDVVRLTVKIFEGQQYKVGEVQVEGVEKFSSEKVQSLLKMRTGKTFTPGDLERDRQAVADFYGAKGFIDLRVQIAKSPNVETGRMDLIYRIEEGEVSYVDKIVIRGNTKTKDKVIRRELAVRPAQIFDMVKVRRSRERLENMNYFENGKVNLEAEPTEIENRKNLAVEVVEKQTGNISFGAGAGSVEQVFGYVEIQETNFDLFNPPRFGGGGQRMKLRAQVGTVSQYYRLSFTEPWFLDRKLRLEVDVFRDELGFLGTYRQQQTGGSVGVSKVLWSKLNLVGGVKYEFKEVNIFDVSDDASVSIQAEEGGRTQSSVIFSLRSDSRDNPFVPTRGQRSEISAKWSGGFLGAETDIYKLDAHTMWFFPLWAKHVLQLSLSTGTVESYGQSDFVPISERYFLGGPNDVRGFAHREVGPKDPVTEDPLGGLTYATATAEYTMPVVTLPKASVRFALFYDVGQVWESAFSYENFDGLNDSIGAGLRFDLLNIPIRLDYAYPLRHDVFNREGGQFWFSFGYRF